MHHFRLLIAVCGFLFSTVLQPATLLAQNRSTEAEDSTKPSCSTPVIATSSGRLCGFEQQIAIEAQDADKTVSTFLGIPYGQTTAGKYRWKPPRPISKESADGSSDVFEATRFGPSCPQSQRPGGRLELSEDCLRLNVWTPAPLRPATTASSLAVMVFIHGGGFLGGSSEVPVLDGRRLAATGDVVVVTPNYRLGALGFLSGIDGLTGNYGLMDQRLALQWVRDNIAAFGGDPDRVTLFGESSGATAVALHLVSPQSQPLFRNAILESNPYGLPFETVSSSSRFAEIFKFNVGCTLSGLDCLRAKSFEEIVAKQEGGLLPGLSVLTGLSAELIWAPVVDGTVVPAQPNASVITKPVVMGTVLDEGLIFAVDDQTAILEEKKSVPRVLYELTLDVLFSSEEADRIERLARYRPLDGDNTQVLSNLITDYLFTCANRRAMELAEGPLWAYQFTHPPSFNVWPAIEACAPGNDTVCHAADLPFVFANAETAEVNPGPQRRQFQPDEKRLSAAVIRYWAEMARESDPNTSGNPHWHQFTKAAPVRLIIDETISSTTDLGANCAFWNEIGYDQPGLLSRIVKFLE